MSGAAENTMITDNEAGAGGKTPPPDHIPDFTMIDVSRLQLIDAVGRARHPFAGVEAWPELEALVRDCSAALLAEAGEAAWAAAGGVLDDRGRPTFRARGSAAAGLALRDVARDPGGFLWADPSGVRWAVRLVPLPGRAPDEYAGLAVSWQGAEMILKGQEAKGVLMAVRDHKVVLAAAGEEEVRQRLAQMANSLWLYGRAEILFWAIQAAVMKQRRSMITLPDSALGEFVWGGDRGKWPENWRGNLFRVLRSLLTLRWAMLRLPRDGWRPRFGAEAVAVAYVEDRQVTSPAGDRCDGACPHRHSGKRHGHFRVGVGPNFLGILERYVVGKSGTERRYDFAQELVGKAGDEVKAAREAGGIVLAHAPTKLLGRVAGLSAGQQRIVAALFRETTRASARRNTAGKKGGHGTAGGGKTPPAAARLIQRGQVPGRSVRTLVSCPLLDAGRTYVAFGGNGRRAGMGYFVRTWAERAGYVEPGGEEPQHAAIRDFLEDLRAVAKDFQLVVAGYRPDLGRWLNDDLLVEMAKTPGGAEELGNVHLRVYGFVDYLERWRARLAARAGFAAPQAGAAGEASGPGGPCGPTAPLTGDARLDVVIRMRRLCVTQRELAEHLKVKQPYVSQILHPGGHGVPAGTLQEIEKYLKAREEAVGLTYNGHNLTVDYKYQVTM